MCKVQTNQRMSKELSGEIATSSRHFAKKRQRFYKFLTIATSGFWKLPMAVATSVLDFLAGQFPIVRFRPLNDCEPGRPGRQGNARQTAIFMLKETSS
jgi:hypothetical protein